jgi:hypothetical protein
LVPPQPEALISGVADLEEGRVEQSAALLGALAALLGQLPELSPGHLALALGNAERIIGGWAWGGGGGRGLVCVCVWGGV